MKRHLSVSGPAGEPAGNRTGQANTAAHVSLQQPADTPDYHLIKPKYTSTNNLQLFTLCVCASAAVDSNCCLTVSSLPALTKSEVAPGWHTISFPDRIKFPGHNNAVRASLMMCLHQRFAAAVNAVMSHRRKERLCIKLHRYMCWAAPLRLSI